jgi:hemerythrin-like domain-containing protein
MSTDTDTDTDTDTGPRPDVNEMIVIHRVFRREFTAIPRLVRAVRAGDVSRAGVVSAHIQLIMAGLHMHHTGEDDVLWPRLLQRAAPSIDIVETMQRQHDSIDEYAAQIDPLAKAWRRDAAAVSGEQLAQVVERFASALVEHLDLEEREILPLVSRHITMSEWDSLGEHGKAAMRPRQLPLMFGAILEEADEAERRRMLAHLPRPVRLVMRTIGARQYRRYISGVRGA